MKHGLIFSRNEAIKASYQNGASLESLAEEFNLGKVYVRDIIRRQGVRLRPKEEKKGPSLEKRPLFLQEYEERNGRIYAEYRAGKTYSVIGEAFGVSRERVRQVVDKCLAHLKEERRKLPSRVESRNAEMYDAFCKGTRLEALALRYNVQVARVVSLLKNEGQGRKMPFSVIRWDRILRTQQDRQRITDRNKDVVAQYRGGMYGKDIASVHRISPGRVYQILQRAGICRQVKAKVEMKLAS